MFFFYCLSAEGHVQFELLRYLSIYCVSFYAKLLLLLLKFMNFIFSILSFSCINFLVVVLITAQYSKLADMVQLILFFSIAEVLTAVNMFFKLVVYCMLFQTVQNHGVIPYQVVSSSFVSELMTDLFILLEPSLFSQQAGVETAQWFGDSKSNFFSMLLCSQPFVLE